MTKPGQRLPLSPRRLVSWQRRLVGRFWEAEVMRLSKAKGDFSCGMSPAQRGETEFRRVTRRQSVVHRLEHGDRFCSTGILISEKRGTNRGFASAPRGRGVSSADRGACACACTRVCTCAPLSTKADHR